jgi:hypothetical protein
MSESSTAFRAATEQRINARARLVKMQPANAASGEYAAMPTVLLGGNEVAVYLENDQLIIELYPEIGVDVEVRAFGAYVEVVGNGYENE